MWSVRGARLGAGASRGLPWGPCLTPRSWPNSHKGRYSPPRVECGVIRFRPYEEGLENAELVEGATQLQPASATEEDLQQLQDRRQLWRKAVKLPMYWVAVVPVLVAAGLVVLEGESLRAAQGTAVLLASVLHLAWLNLSNDVFDSSTGVDLLKKESVVRLTGKPRLVLGIAAIALVASVALFTAAGGMGPNGFGSLLLFALSIICGYVYQGPPFRLGYQGLGEPLCFFAFGPFSTIASYLVMNPRGVGLAAISATAWACSSVVGLTSAVVLFCSHFHQYEGDKLAGKKSPVVRLGGITPAMKVLQWVSYAPFLWLGILTMFGIIPPGSLLLTTLFGVSKAVDLNSFAFEHYSNPDILCCLKLVALKLHYVFGVTLSTSLIAAGILNL